MTGKDLYYDKYLKYKMGGVITYIEKFKYK